MARCQKILQQQYQTLSRCVDVPAEGTKFVSWIKETFTFLACTLDIDHKLLDCWTHYLTTYAIKNSFIHGLKCSKLYNCIWNQGQWSVQKRRYSNVQHFSASREVLKNHWIVGNLWLVLFSFCSKSLCP